MFATFWRRGYLCILPRPPPEYKHNIAPENAYKSVPSGALSFLVGISL